MLGPVSRVCIYESDMALLMLGPVSHVCVYEGDMALPHARSCVSCGLACEGDAVTAETNCNSSCILHGAPHSSRNSEDLTLMLVLCPFFLAVTVCSFGAEAEYTVKSLDLVIY